MILPDLSIGKINYTSIDDKTTVTGEDAVLTELHATYSIYFKDPDPNDPNKVIDYLNIEKIYIKDATVNSLHFYKETISKDEASNGRVLSLIVPDGKTVTINGLEMKGWKLTWDYRDKIKASMMTDNNNTVSTFHADAFKLPESTEFSSYKGESSSMIANALTDVQFFNIDFNAIIDPQSKAQDKTIYSYGFENASGKIGMGFEGRNAKGKTSQTDMAINLEGLQLYDGIYYKESDSADVVQFKLNSVNMTDFDYMGDTLAISAYSASVFDDIGFSAHINYEMDPQNKTERFRTKSVMLDEFWIGSISSTSLAARTRKDKNAPWNSIPIAALTGPDQSLLQAISIKGLGRDLVDDRFIVNENTLITAGYSKQFMPAVFIPFLTTYFGTKFGAEFKNLTVGNITMQGSANGMLNANITGIAIDDLAIKQFSVGTPDKLTITSSGNPAHLKKITADISVGFDINQETKELAFTVTKLDAEQLELYGLTVKIGKDKTIELKPDQKSTIDKLHIEGLKITRDAAGKKWTTDYSKTVATTGKVDAADLSVQLGNAFSFESGAEAKSISFKGTGGSGFDLTINQPSVTNINDKSPVSGKAGAGITFGNEGSGPVVKGTSLTIKKDPKDGKMSYVLKDPAITGLKIDLPEKGVHLVIDANMIGGEMDVTDGLDTFGEDVVSAWVMTATQDFKITKVQIIIDEFAKLKSQGKQGASSNDNPYAFLDTVTDSKLFVNVFGGTLAIPITDGKIDLINTLDLLGGVMETSVNSLVNINTNSDADKFFKFINGYRSHLDPWQQTFIDNYMSVGSDAVGTLVHDLIAQASPEDINGIWVLRLTLFGGQELRRRELVEDTVGNYDDNTHLLLLSKTILYQQNHPQIQTDAEIAQQHAQLLTDQGIDQAEYDRIVALPFDRINSEDDLVGEMHEAGVMPWPDKEVITRLLTVWLTAHFATYLSQSLNFSFGADLKHLNAEKLISGLKYSSEAAKNEGISLNIGTDSKADFIDLKSLSVPSIEWINPTKTTKVIFTSLKFSSNGFKLDAKAKTKAFTGDLTDGSISGLKISFKK